MLKTVSTTSIWSWLQLQQFLFAYCMLYVCVVHLALFCLNYFCKFNKYVFSNYLLSSSYTAMLSKDCQLLCINCHFLRLFFELLLCIYIQHEYLDCSTVLHLDINNEFTCVLFLVHLNRNMFAQTFFTNPLFTEWLRRIPQFLTSNFWILNFLLSKYSVFMKTWKRLPLELSLV